MVDLVLDSAELTPYRIELSESAGMGSTRAGAVVRLTCTNGLAAWGDVAPLPSFSTESMTDVFDAWRRSKGLLTDRPLPSFDLTQPDGTRELTNRFGPASLRFGLEQALMGITARHRGVHPLQLVAPEAADSIEVAGLITSRGFAALDNSLRLVESGYRTLKVKVGRQRVDEDIELVLSLRRALGENVALRLDANRAWTVAQATAFLSGIAGVDFEFLEEPLHDSVNLRQLFESTGAAIALDETLLTIEPAMLPAWSFATHVIVKPTLLGGIMRTEALVMSGRKYGMTPVVSAAYESGLGVSFLACLAARWCPAGPAAGLGTYHYLMSDILARRLTMGPDFDLLETQFQPEES